MIKKLLGRERTEKRIHHRIQLNLKGSKFPKFQTVKPMLTQDSANKMVVIDRISDLKKRIKKFQIQLDLFVDKMD